MLKIDPRDTIAAFNENPTKTALLTLKELARTAAAIPFANLAVQLSAQAKNRLSEPLLQIAYFASNSVGTHRTDGINHRMPAKTRRHIISEIDALLEVCR